MALYAISDLHLSFTDNKPMDIFGAVWHNHTEQIRQNWLARITPADTVLLGGDLSWSMTLTQARRELDFIAALPGRKILLTNAPLLYALAVLKALRLLPLFDSFWGVEEMRLHGEHRPKPSVSMLRHILWREGLSARRTVLVEDTLDNLKAARRLGLRTVHIHHPGTPFAPAMSGRPHYVDRRLRRVGGLLVPSARPGGGDAT